MIASGDLCSFKAFAPSKPDLSGVKVTAGEYQIDQLSERLCSDKVLTADIVQTWLEKADGRPTMLFAVDRAHAAHLHDEFCGAGVTSAYVDAFTDMDERAAVKKLFHNGDVKVVCRVGTMTHGIDWDVRCVQFCRPTKSPILLVQALGTGAAQRSRQGSLVDPRPLEFDLWSLACRPRSGSRICLAAS